MKLVMITTREAINYQFSVIFGYSSPKDDDLIVGDVIGPGHLTKEKVKELSIDVIKFIKMYNAILRDYTGSELFSIEFSLFNKDDLQKHNKSGDIRIFPQSMILMPGKYKDCECILLALKPERSTLNVHKSREIVNKVGRFFSEIEEIIDRPELNRIEQELVLQRFANRFGIRLYGEILEGKWNKKLIGLNASLPTSKKMIHTYAATKSDVRILWHKNPHEINTINHKFEVNTTPYHGKIAIDHLKYSISEPSANFIVENTLKLGTDLFNLCNTGTIDVTQDSFISFIIKRLLSNFENVNENVSINSLITSFKYNLNLLKQYTNKFLEYTNSFITTGEKGDLSELLLKYKKFIIKKTELDYEDYNQLLNITERAISQSIVQEKGLRVAELKSIMNYMKEIIKNSYDIIIKAFPRYLSKRRMKLLTINFIKKLKDVYDKEQKPSKILGNEYIDKFYDYFLNEIEIHSDLLIKYSEIDESQILDDFKHLINSSLDSFFKEISLNIAEIISFAKQDMETDSKEIEEEIKSFRRFPGEIHYLLGYIMKYTTINRFLKEEIDAEISDPVSFSNKFHRFLEKKIGGINLTWKSYVLDWMKDYAKQFFKRSSNTPMDLKEIYNDFLKFFEYRESKEQKPEEFLKFLRNFIDKINNEVKKRQLNEFYKQFEFCIELKNVFPELVKAKIKSEVNNLDLKLESTAPINFFNIDGKETFYQFIKESELKYFSKLIPRPLSIILKHDLSSEEKETFSNSLFHIINFKFGLKHSKFYLADNFKSIYKEWEKEV